MSDPMNHLDRFGAASRSERGAGRSCACGAFKGEGEMFPAWEAGVVHRLDAPCFHAAAPGEDSGNGPKAQVVANANPGPAAQSPQEGAASPDDLRADGWTVAVHNDYRQGDERFTFWLLTKGRYNVKGEGRTDADALNEVRRALAEPGRSADRRPRNPESSPVASADPELAKLLREARAHHIADNNLCRRIDSALSRLAGQAATKEDSQ